MDFRQLERSERLGMDMEVTDTGIGISPRFQKLLFDPFTQENAAILTQTAVRDWDLPLQNAW